MNENYNTPNSGCCGRLMHYDATPKCNYNSCCMNEYAYKQKACIRNKQPDCEAQAVIPSITVETVDGITNLANCLVHVTSTNTTYYVDDKHRIMITWAGPVNIPGYDMEGNPEGFKDQIVTDTEAGAAVIYDKNGIGYTFGIQEGLDVQEEINNKLDAMVEDGTLETLIENTAFKNLDITSNYTITTEEKTATDLVYHVTRLHSNLESTNIPLRNVLCGDTFVESVVDANQKNLYEMSKKNIRPVFMSNCDSKGSMENCVVIRDGEVFRQNATGSTYSICGLTSDGNFKVYPRLESATQAVTDDIVNTWGCSIIISNGSIDQTTWSDATSDLVNNKHPRTVMFQLQNDKDIYFVHVEGRTAESTGLTFLETANLILSDFPTVNNAVVFGGGGDSQLMIHGNIINKCNDQQLRPLYEAIYLDANVDYSDYNTASREIADARIFNNTLFDYIKSLPLTDGYKYGDELIELTVASSDQYHQYLTGSINNKVIFDKDSVIFVKFPDLSSYEWNTTVRLNIHYDIGSTTKDIKTEDGNSVQPYMVSNKVLALKYDVSEKEYTLIRSQKVIDIIPNAQDRDLNNLKREGLFCANAWTNYPSNFASTASGGIVKVEKSPVGDWIYQTFRSTDNVIYTRVFHSNAWSNWNTIQGSERVAKNGLDCNNLINKFVVLSGNNLVNKPTDTQNGTLVNIPYGSDNYNAQLFFERGTSDGHGRIFHRNQENNVWGSWKQISFVS